MANKPKYISSIGFTDLLFNIVVGLAFLFIMAFVLINPISKEKDVEEKSDFIIILTWHDDSGDDIDLWVRDPDGNLLSFRNKEAGLMHLDRDDLGLANDHYFDEKGSKKYLYRNKEVASLRGYRPGEYLINLHVYNRKPDRYKQMNQPLVGTVTLIKLNPYKEIMTSSVDIKKRGQEFSMIRFTLDVDGEVEKKEKPLLAEKLIGTQALSTYDTQDLPGDANANEETRLFFEGW